MCTIPPLPPQPALHLFPIISPDTGPCFTPIPFITNGYCLSSRQVRTLLNHHLSTTYHIDLETARCVSITSADDRNSSNSDCCDSDSSTSSLSKRFGPIDSLPTSEEDIQNEVIFWDYSRNQIECPSGLHAQKS
jgi:hypothetical protein